MASKEEIVLSVEETNALRAKLGLKPLRLSDDKVSRSHTYYHTLCVLTLQLQKSKDDGASAKKDESSLSIDETNKLRAKLGLKPLNNVESDSKQKKVVDKPPEVVDERALEAQARIERSRKRRRLKEKLGTATLGDGEATSTAAWLGKSNRLQKEAMVAIEREKELREEEEAASKVAPVSYDASQLGGIKLSHDLEEHVRAGEEVILTLKDSELIDKKTGKLVEEKVDELENAYIAEGERYRKKLRKEKLIKQSKQSYAGLDEEDDGTSKTLLGKYDVDEKDQERKPAGVIDASGNVQIDGGDSKRHSHEAARPSLMSVAAENMGILGANESDFMTVEEAQSKEKKFKKKKLKKRKRKKAKENTYRPAISEADMIGDKDEAEVVENLASKKLKNQHGRTATVADADIDDTDDMGLQEALTKARRALKRRRKPEQDASSANMDEENEGEGHVFKSEERVAALEDSESRVLSGATEFSSSIEQSVETLRSAHKETDESQVKVDPDVKMEVEGDERVKVKQEGGVTRKDNPEHVTSILNGDTKLASGGMAAALAAFKGAGEVVKVAAKEKNPVVSSKRRKDFNFKDIDLTYRDKSGKLLTTKEAYLELCYKFHGIRPGKKSIAKKKRKEEQQKRTQNMGLGDTPLGTASALRKVQAKTGAAFIKLDMKEAEK